MHSRNHRPKNPGEIVSLLSSTKKYSAMPGGFYKTDGKPRCRRLTVLKTNRLMSPEDTGSNGRLFTTLFTSFNIAPKTSPNFRVLSYRRIWSSVTIPSLAGLPVGLKCRCVPSLCDLSFAVLCFKHWFWLSCPLLAPTKFDSSLEYESAGKARPFMKRCSARKDEHQLNEW